MSKFLISMCCLVITINFSFAANYSSVDTFIKKQKLIRVFTDNAPGFGNQTATMNVMTKLRTMGFSGQFEFIYSNLTVDKITQLYNLPKNLPDDYLDEKNNIRFIKIKPHLKRVFDGTIELVDIGITGANDSGECSLAQKDGVPVDFYSPLCSDTANFFSVRSFIDLDPYLGRDSIAHHSSGTEFYIYNPKAQPKEDTLSQVDSYKKFLLMPVSSFKSALEFLENDPQGIKIANNKPALLPFLNAINTQKFNVMNIYGYTLQENYRNPVDWFANILQVISGARFAQLHGNITTKKPLIIPIYFNYQKEASILINLIHSGHWGKFEITGAENARKALNDLKLLNNFFIADINDKSTIEKIKNLQEGQILLLIMGSFPKNVFDGIYTYTGKNIWPAVREGANTFNSLILTGTPHFRCYPSWELDFDLIKDEKLKSELQNFYSNKNFCAGMKTWAENPETYQTLGNLILQSQDPHSSFATYFNELRDEAIKPDNDRIRYAFEGVINFFN